MWLWSFRTKTITLVSSSFKFADIKKHDLFILISADKVVVYSMWTYLNTLLANMFSVNLKLPPCTQSTPPSNSFRYYSSFIYIYQSSLVSFYIPLDNPWTTINMYTLLKYTVASDNCTRWSYYYYSQITGVWDLLTQLISLMALALLTLQPLIPCTMILLIGMSTILWFPKLSLTT